MDIVARKISPQKKWSNIIHRKCLDHPLLDNTLDRWRASYRIVAELMSQWAVWLVPLVRTNVWSNTPAVKTVRCFHLQIVRIRTLSTRRNRTKKSVGWTPIFGESFGSEQRLNDRELPEIVAEMYRTYCYKYVTVRYTSNVRTGSTWSVIRD